MKIIIEIAHTETDSLKVNGRLPAWRRRQNRQIGKGKKTVDTRLECEAIPTGRKDSIQFPGCSPMPGSTVYEVQWPDRDITHSCANCGHARNLHPRGGTCSVHECQCRDFQAE